MNRQRLSTAEIIAKLREFSLLTSLYQNLSIVNKSELKHLADDLQENEKENAVPLWVNAPEWATHCAMDEDGKWFWYEGEPIISHRNNEWKPKRTGDYVGKVEIAKTAAETWRDSLMERPK